MTKRLNQGSVFQSKQVFLQYEEKYLGKNQRQIFTRNYSWRCVQPQKSSRSVNAVNALRVRTGIAVVTSLFKPEVLKLLKHAAQLINKERVRGLLAAHIRQAENCRTCLELMLPSKKFLHWTNVWFSEQGCFGLSEQSSKWITPLVNYILLE